MISQIFFTFNTRAGKENRFLRKSPPKPRKARQLQSPDEIGIAEM